MSFRITGLNPTPFRHLYGMSDADLSALNARRYTADRLPGFPDRVELRDAEPGESVLLLNYTHQPEQTPYRSSHAIFVREGAEVQYDEIDTIPDSLGVRLMALRAFDARHDMIAAEIVEGTQLKSLIGQFFDIPEAAYLHAHYARRGCYAARIDRTQEG
ncbi:hypothetical protein Gain_0151_003 [Komagataeibacter intermedius TF2]|uniref:DUF1203 domain-containing protein n=3 Tax=Komagataeibacter intermedius TaxID=66229 RepID=A0A0N0MED9_9PROT|nr:hypothetical protein GLUCOINTEAF2_0203399 [Komagataeibacter intermedius AF2]GAN88202.1 hypothetical protein Gain_0151_003 [Komagataeibacter intermedius TF2]GBQ77660.1 hypothetical protein AA0521_3046 [Komagataeibacter intermedius NRIC 0521]